MTKLLELHSVGKLVLMLLENLDRSVLTVTQDRLIRPHTKSGQGTRESEDGKDDFLEVGEVRPLECT